ncbi:MAG: hypothetical protein HFJ28_06355 [Clostridia bacterium]|nr:hypothetical protein [Clostridia bacterium]
MSKKETVVQVVQKNKQQITKLGVRLVAGIGDCVYYLRPQIDCDDSESVKIAVSKERIVKGTVCNIKTDDTRVFMRIDRDDGYVEESRYLVEMLQSPEVENLQEFFFATLEEAENAVDRLNDGQHEWSSTTWAEECKKILNASYPYELHFPVEAGEIVEGRRVPYGPNILVESVWTNINIDPSETKIYYRGKPTWNKPSKPKFEGKYKIVKAKKKH